MKPSSPGTPGILPGYVFLESLGCGGMGEVFRARQESLGREVAVKVLRGDLAAAGWLPERFEREARTMAALNHPNLVIVHDSARFADGRVAIVMELVRGGALRKYLDASPKGLPVSQALKWACEIAEGLRAAHAAGIVHRDVKPENILIDVSGSARVSDFGMACSALTNATRYTAEGAALGTFGYMAPEQLRGETADQRADVFAFGIVLYEMLAGRLPQGNFRPIRELRREVPSAVDRLIQAALRPDVEQRPSGMQAVLDALPSPGSANATPLTRRSWIAAGLASGIAGIAWYLSQRRPSAIDLQPRPTVSPGSSWRRIKWPLDLRASAISGGWRVEEGSLLSDGEVCIMPLAQQMPDAWKVRLRFRRLGGIHSVAVFFRTPQGVASYDLDGWSKGISGVESVGGRTTIEAGGFPLSLVNDRIYDWTIEIRPEVIRSWLNDDTLPERRIAGEPLSVVEPWSWKPAPDAPALSIGSWRSPTRFEWIEWKQA
jgi:hypothetical protein